MSDKEQNIEVTIDPAHFRSVLGNYPTGVCVITAMHPEDGAVGMVVGSFGSVSLDPPLVAFYIDRNSRSWEKISQCGNFCVNVLGEDQQDLVPAIAGRKADKFRDVAHRLSDHGIPVLDAVVAYIECAIDQQIDAGDHFIVLGRVLNLTAERDTGPLLFFRGGYGRFERID